MSGSPKYHGLALSEQMNNRFCGKTASSCPSGDLAKQALPVTGLRPSRDSREAFVVSEALRKRR